MSKARNLADVISGAYDVPAEALDNAIVGDGDITAAKLADTLDLSGKTLTLPAGVGGKVLQVLHYNFDELFYSTSTSFTNITANSETFQLAITPSSTSSKILVIASVSISKENNHSALFRLRRNTTTIGGGKGSQSAYESGVSLNIRNTIYNVASYPITVLDSPNTTSSCTYTIQGKTSSSSLGFAVNRTINNANAAYDNDVSSTITLLEIAG